MNICFEAEENNDKLNTFLHNWENPSNAMTAATNATFVEFKVRKFKDLIIISQSNIYDVVAKFLVYSGAGLMLMMVLITMITEQVFYTSIWFNIGFGIVFIGALWLSPYYRYLLIYLKLRMIGYKGKLKYVNNGYALSKVINEAQQNGTKRNIRAS